MHRAPCRLLTSLLVLMALAPGARAGDAPAPEDPFALALPSALDALELHPDWELVEGTRSLRDVFPYLAVRPRDVEHVAPQALTPSSLGGVLRRAPTADGAAGAVIPDGAAALAAVRLFVAGPLVRTEAEAERILAVGRRLREELRLLPVELTDHRPTAWAPSAQALVADAGRPGGRAWEVSLVAFELDRQLRLVHVVARVEEGGALRIERHPIVDGPMTSWQTGSLDGEGAGAEANDRAMHQEADHALALYGEALRDGPFRAEDAWAITRALDDFPPIARVLGRPTADLGSGIHIHPYPLAEGGRLLIGWAGPRLTYARIEPSPAAAAEGARRRPILTTG